MYPLEKQTELLSQAFITLYHARKRGLLDSDPLLESEATEVIRGCGEIIKESLSFSSLIDDDVIFEKEKA